jgi:hypothetical protein
MDDKELAWLSQHLAHDVNTHKQHYRKHDAAIEIAKVGRLMMAADAGELGKYKGKTLADIAVEGKKLTYGNGVSCVNILIIFLIHNAVQKIVLIINTPPILKIHV